MRRLEVAAEHQVLEHPPIPDVPQDEEKLSAVAAHFAARRREVEPVVAADKRQRTVATDVRVYFCDPQSPWQRGSNENTNGLLRQYFPRGRDLSHVSQAQLNAVARALNTRPRKTLGYRTPAAVLAFLVATTG